MTNRAPEASRKRPASRTSPSPKGRYHIDGAKGRALVTEPAPAYEATAPTVISATEAARNFSDFVSRACFQGETFIIERGGRPICQLGPIESRRCTGAELLALLAKLPRPADEFLDAVEEASRASDPVGLSPWES